MPGDLGDAVELVFVSPEGQSAFMAELLAAVADVAAREGARTRSFRGTLDRAGLTERSVAVVIPHEYLAIDADPEPRLLARTVAFGVEHPGTGSYEMSVAAAPRFAALFEINDFSIAESRRRGLDPQRFTLGYSPLWDYQSESAEPRSTDIIHLGTLDPRRAQILSRIAGDLAHHEVRLLLAPHEPMTGPRPDFLMGPDKWAALAQSSVLLNLHRENSTAFEWVRCLEAMINGCVVVSEHSSGFAPLVPGEHVVFASPESIGAVAGHLARRHDDLVRLRSAASELVRKQLDMAPSARRLIDRALDIVDSAPPPPAPDEGQRLGLSRETGLAEWFPVLSDAERRSDQRGALAVEHAIAGANAALRARIVRLGELQDGSDPTVHVLCARLPGDGPIAATVESLGRQGVAWSATFATTDDRGPGLRGAVRNSLLADLAASPAPPNWVAVVDSGDEFLPGGLQRLLAAVPTVPSAQPEADGPDVIVGVAAHPGGLLNALRPEARRLAIAAYLGRGYLVRTRYLLQVGWSEHPMLDGMTDYAFWRMAVAARTVLVPQITTRLWPQSPPARMVDIDPDAVWAAVEHAVPLERHPADQARLRRR